MVGVLIERDVVFGVYELIEYGMYSVCYGDCSRVAKCGTKELRRARGKNFGLCDCNVLCVC